ncbi:MAG: alpha-amylase family glycosyl hydrolase [Candidatus Binataceae bacterium]
MQPRVQLRVPVPALGGGAFRAAVAETEALLGADAWPTYTLSNHDFPRHITRYRAGGDTDARARVAAMMLLSLRGTPFLYYGEEIGMPNVEITRERIRDCVGRDGCRTPMQWRVAPHGGFTSAHEPWMSCGDFTRVSVDRQANDPDSLLSFYRRMIALRRNSPALREGSYRCIADAPDDCFVYARETSTQRILVALNFSGLPRDVRVARGTILLSTLGSRAGQDIDGVLSLAPNQAAIIALR